MEGEGRRSEAFDCAFGSYTQNEKRINNEGDVVDKIIPGSAYMT